MSNNSNWMLVLIIIDKWLFNRAFIKKNSNEEIHRIQLESDRMSEKESDWMTKSIFGKEMKSKKE